MPTAAGARALPAGIVSRGGGRLPRLPQGWLLSPTAGPAGSGSGTQLGPAVQVGGTDWWAEAQPGLSLLSWVRWPSLPTSAMSCPAQAPTQPALEDTASQRTHSRFKSSQDLGAESSGCPPDDFSARCAAKIPPRGGPLGTLCPAFLPEGEGTAPPMQVRRNPF